MKKILLVLFLSIFLFCGCESTMNTPTSKVEDYLGKYQKLDKDVLSDLDDVIDNDDGMNESQKKDYRELLEKQYQNLSYKIKGEDINGDKATVDVEIEVLDYRTTVDISKEYYLEHPEEFKEKDNIEGNIKDDVEKVSSYIDYKIKQLKGVNNKTKYDITFDLTKEDGIWKIDDLNDSDRQKLHGLY